MTLARVRPAAWRVRGGAIALRAPVVAGILNVTPDSFSDGGRHLEPERALEAARRMVDEGVDLIDVGAESTRPGAGRVSAEEQWRRLAPVLEGLGRLDVPVSVDTTRRAVAERALDLGVVAINDVSGLGDDPGLADLAAETGAGLVLMHMRGTPRTMQRDTRYEDIVDDVLGALGSAREVALDRGCAPEQIAVDPGLGFGKSVEGNLELIARLEELTVLGAPIWIGPSRKSFLGKLLDAEPDARLAGTIAACLAAARNGADVLRVHDVRPVRDALRVAAAIDEAGP